MKLSNQNVLREELSNELMNFFAAKGEDVAMVTSNTFNFPTVKNEEEGWVEIVVKVVKYDDEEGYGKREDYEMKLEANALKKAEREKKKAEKIKKDKQKRLEKELAREAEKAKLAQIKGE